MENKTLFIVDDDQFYINILHQKLENVSEYKIEKFYSGQECINNAHKQPDIIFLDHFLGDTDGFEVLKDLKATYPDIHIIMLSGQKELKTAIKTLRFGATDYLIKGLDDSPEKLKNIINDCETLNKMKPKAESNKNLFGLFTL